MFEKRRIKWIVPLDLNGNFLGSLEPTCGKGNAAHLGKTFAVPYEYRNSAVKARLLADTAEYVLGVIPSGADPTSTAARHAAFILAVSKCAEATGNSSVRAVQLFLNGWFASDQRLPETLLAGDQVTFRVEGIYPIEDPEIALYWNTLSDSAQNGSGTKICVICGRLGQQKKSKHFKLRGLPGGRTTGTALVSANIRAAESYGLQSRDGVPICWQCEESATRAINHLLSNPSSRIFFGNTTFIFWSNQACPFDLRSMLLSAQGCEPKILETCILSGKPAAAHFESTGFYVAALSANGARAVVRDWAGLTLTQLKHNLTRYFQLQRLITPNGTPGQPLGLLDLVVAPRASDSMALEMRYLMRLALGGGALPYATLAACVRRNRVERRVTRARAVLIKMVLLSRSLLPRGEKMESLDFDNTQPAYVCGRLLAVLEHIQRLASGPIASSIADRFFSTASVVPGVVYPHLARLARAHLKTLRVRHPRLFLTKEAELAAVIAKIQHFPGSFSLVEQGLFALGYYHQHAFDRKCASQKRRHLKIKAVARPELEGRI
jgi:CRISPR-associated protein Csd1